LEQFEKLNADFGTESSGLTQCDANSDAGFGLAAEQLLAIAYAVCWPERREPDDLLLSVISTWIAGPSYCSALFRQIEPDMQFA
jgi:hypothetical protein